MAKSLFPKRVLSTHLFLLMYGLYSILLDLINGNYFPELIEIF